MAHPSDGRVWAWLVGLLAAGLAAGLLPAERAVILAVALVAAALKAVLIARHYMHLRHEPRWLIAIALVPVALVVGLAAALVPDLVWGR